MVNSPFLESENLSFTEFINKLKFRRQFLLGPKEFKPTEDWNSLQINHNLIVSIHPELKTTSTISDKKSVIIIGNIVDPLNPHLSISEIVNNIIANGACIEDVIQGTYALTGRWLLIYQDENDTGIFTDPCGFRTAYYVFSDDGFWCGSQPEIINSAKSLEVDDEILLNSFRFSTDRARNESAWIGNRTIYRNCFHLMPNHYLKVSQVKQVRFYPIEKLPKINYSTIIDLTSTILQGTLEAIAGKQKVLQALTAGWDSRVLLAASRNYSNNIEYFIDRKGMLPEEHQDVWVPKSLAKKLGINLNIINSIEDPPDWFISILSKNVTGARILPKSRTIYHHLVNNETMININGNGSEICRNFFDKYLQFQNNQINCEELALIIGYPNIQYVVDELRSWKNSLFSLGGEKTNILDYLYWEQRLGNWGAQYPAEQDIAIEEFSPFNCRMLIETLMIAPRETRAAPHYTIYRDIICSMWPEALSIPINPGSDSKINKIKRIFKPFFYQ
ncbi:MAG: hypothetical protein M5U05_03830 [Anaerolineales bacterium]|nr:hypothetical protein [Anaerolineales bacterium]